MQKEGSNRVRILKTVQKTGDCDHHWTCLSRENLDQKTNNNQINESYDTCVTNKTL